MTTVSRIHDLSGSAAVQSQAVGGDRLKKNNKKITMALRGIKLRFFIPPHPNGR